jgi:phosphoribosylformylglycinamidine cyclo-ligase
VVLGLGSSGVHSNGFSLVRKVMADSGLGPDSAPPFESGAPDLGAALLTPTRIYVRACLAALRGDGLAGAVRGLAHITGGGLVDNLPRVLPDGLGAEIDAGAWALPPVFRWLKAAGGLTDADLARTFNCGIGMAVVADPDRADAVAETLVAHGETVQRIGRVTEGSGIRLTGTEAAWRA